MEKKTEDEMDTVLMDLFVGSARQGHIKALELGFGACFTGGLLNPKPYTPQLKTEAKLFLAVHGTLRHGNMGPYP